MPHKTRISVIIPHLNNVNKLNDCLEALSSCSGNYDVEFLVVDNGSTQSLDGLKQKFPKIIWLLETSLASPYPCRNKGILHASGDILILLDSNCVPLNNFFQEGIKMLNQGYDVCGGHLQLNNGNGIASKFDLLYSTIDHTNKDIKSLPGACLFIRKEILYRVKLFLPCVRSLGDIEWTNRVYRAGYKLGITEKPIAEYEIQKWRQFCKKMIRLGRGKKEVYVNKGGKLNSIYWISKVAKNFLPPNPSFITRMNKINHAKETQLSIMHIIVFCYLTKILRGVGMITSKILPPCFPSSYSEDKSLFQSTPSNQ